MCVAGYNPFKDWARLVDCGDVLFSSLDNRVTLRQLEKAHRVGPLFGISDAAYPRHMLPTRKLVHACTGDCGTHCEDHSQVFDPSNHHSGRRPHHYPGGFTFDLHEVGCSVCDTF